MPNNPPKCYFKQSHVSSRSQRVSFTFDISDGSIFTRFLETAILKPGSGSHKEDRGYMLVAVASVEQGSKDRMKSHTSYVLL